MSVTLASRKLLSSHSRDSSVWRKRAGTSSQPPMVGPATPPGRSRVTATFWFPVCKTLDLSNAYMRREEPAARCRPDGAARMAGWRTTLSICRMGVASLVHMARPASVRGEGQGRGQCFIVQTDARRPLDLSGVKPLIREEGLGAAPARRTLSASAISSGA
jgi:hypothetical protein